MGILEHVGSMLHQASHLGETNFFGRNKRFGAVVDTGDNLYIDLANEQISSILNALIVSLQSVQGEGKTKRSLVKEPAKESGQNEGDASLSVSHQLGRLQALLIDNTFLNEAVFDQSKFELTYDIKWSGAS